MKHGDKAKTDIALTSAEPAGAIEWACNSLELRASTLFLIAYLLVTQLVIAVLSCEWLLNEQVPYAVMGATSLLFILASIRYMPLAFTLWLVTSIALHVVLGVRMDCYQTSACYDKLVHVLLMAWLVLLVSCFVYKRLPVLHSTLTTPICLVVNLTLALAMGAAWEMFEFTMDQTGLFKAQRGLVDTMLDLFADAVGGLVVCGIVLLTQRNVLPSGDDACT